ncbi:amidohydrolase family protein [Maribacter flavus]|uniref:Amidohydrolase family protein n=1 Tax=Maribacter flavus TaxID=1658664 RepID=A0A5B2TRP9_9FLAO|nr:amidohydrolase family protein [Maribacter flavus]KAA2216773.1 amidohydrolase family protein [Maribacter flavus]
MRYSLLLLGIGMVFLLLINCEAEKRVSYDTLLKGGNILNLEDGSVVVGDIYISDGRIAKVAYDEIYENSTAKNVVDATGKFILPGFWDNHVHFRGGDSLIEANKRFLGLFIANGITTVRDAGGDLTTAVMQWKMAIENDGMIGPTIFTSGPKIDGPGATWAGSLEVENQEDINKALDSLQAIPTDFVKIYDSKISGENYLNTIRAAEKRGLITSGHMPFTATLESTIDAGIDAVEHLYYIMKGCSTEEAAITQQLQDEKIGFWDAMPILQSTYNDSVAKQTFEHLKQKNVFVVPTLHIGHTLSYLDEVDHSEDAYLKYMSPGIQKTYEGRIQRAQNASEKAIQDRKELDTFFKKLALTLNQNDVSLLAGSDSGAFNSYTYPGISLHKEMEAMVDAGISPLDALKASAYNGAKFLKKESDYGSLKTGKQADIVILNQNPLENIQNTQDIFMVLKNGNSYSQEDLNKLLQ